MTWSRSARQRAGEHIEALGRRHRIEVVYTSVPERWQAVIGLRQVYVPKPTSGLRYMVGLHELGHVCSRVARRWQPRYEELGGEALVEGAAWAWATMMADPELAGLLTAEDWEETALLYCTYLRDAAWQPAPLPGGQARI